MKNEKSVKINIILNIMKTLLSIIFPLITFPYVSRILSTESIGKVQYSVSIVSYFLLLSSLGISTYAIREGASFRDDKEKLKKFCNEIYSINLITTFVSYVLLLILLLFSKNLSRYYVLIMIQSLTIIFTTLGVDWINSIYEDYLYITIRSLIVQILVLIFTFIFIRNPDDYNIYAIITVISATGANIFNLFYIRKKISLSITFNIDWKKHLKPILILFSSNLATTIYKDSDLTMLGIMCNDFVVGIYYFGSKIYQICKQLLNSALAVLIPRVSYYNKQNLIEKKDNLLNSMIKIMILVIPPIVIGMIMLRQEIVLLIGGEKYIQSSTTLGILSIALFFSVVANFFVNVILITHNEENKAMKATITAAFINFSLNLFFIKFFGEKGAAMTTLFSEFIVAFISLICAKKYLKFQKMNSFIAISIIECLAIFVLDKILRILIFNNIILMFSLIFISILIYLILILFIRKDIKKVLKEI